MAEKSGRIRVYPTLTSTTPTTFVDLAPKVHNFWDRGLLGLELDPAFPANPYVYALYAHDAAIGGTAPRWNDACPSPPGPTSDGCVISGRLSRFAAVGNVAGTEELLIEGWCQQYPSHSIADLGSDRTAPCTSAPAMALASPSPTMAREAGRAAALRHETHAGIRPAGWADR